MAVTLDIAQFRTQFPAFADDTLYPDVVIQQYFDVATCYIANDTNYCLSNACLLQAIYLMTAHLLAIQAQAIAGKTASFVKSATVGSVTVSLQPPPETDQWSWWLSLTPYGQQLYALLSSVTAAGFFIGGLPEGAAFRKVGGSFYRG